MGSENEATRWMMKLEPPPSLNAISRDFAAFWIRPLAKVRLLASNSNAGSCWIVSRDKLVPLDRRKSNGLGLLRHEDGGGQSRDNHGAGLHVERRLLDDRVAGIPLNCMQA